MMHMEATQAYKSRSKHSIGNDSQEVDAEEIVVGEDDGLVELSMESEC